MARLQPLPNKDRSNNPPPEKPDDEGWLVSTEHQLLCQYKPGMAAVHALWVVASTYRKVPTRPPVLQALRRMLRHNAIAAWVTMLKIGWRRCPHPPSDNSDLIPRNVREGASYVTSVQWP